VERGGRELLRQERRDVGAPAAVALGVQQPWGHTWKGAAWVVLRWERGGVGAPTAAAARAAWNLHAAVALGFSPVRGLGGKWKCVRSVGRETSGQLAVQRLEKIHVPRCVPMTNEI
jgi:hypothetical protein